MDKCIESYPFPSGGSKISVIVRSSPDGSSTASRSPLPEGAKKRGEALSSFLCVLKIPIELLLPMCYY